MLNGKSKEEQEWALRQGGLEVDRLQNLRLVYRQGRAGSWSTFWGHAILFSLLLACRPCRSPSTFFPCSFLFFLCVFLLYTLPSSPPLFPFPGNTVSRKDLEELRLEKFNTILILADEADEASNLHRASDSRSLATLLIVRDIQRRRMEAEASLAPAPLLVAEILDPQTQTLVSSIDNSDYVMSNDIVSAAIAQVSECRALNYVVNELLSSTGCELYFKPARRYAMANERLCFWDIMSRARNLDEVRPGPGCRGAVAAPSFFLQQSYPHRFPRLAQTSLPSDICPLRKARLCSTLPTRAREEHGTSGTRSWCFRRRDVPRRPGRARI